MQFHGAWSPRHFIYNRLTQMTAHPDFQLNRCLLFTLLSCGFVCSAGTAAPRYRVAENLTSAGFETAVAINNLGHAVGTSATGNLLWWDGHQTHDLGTANAASIVPQAIDDSDTIVGYSNSDVDLAKNRSSAFEWKFGYFSKDFASTLPATRNAARAINSHGIVAGDHGEGALTGLVIRATQSDVSLPAPFALGWGRVTAVAINNSGHVLFNVLDNGIPVFSENTSTSTYLYSKGANSMILFRGNFGMSGSTQMEGFDLNDAGAIVGRATRLDLAPSMLVSPFVYVLGERLNLLPSSAGYNALPGKLSINNRGMITGTGEGYQPTLWSGGVPFQLSDIVQDDDGHGIAVWDPVDLNDRGQILAKVWVGQDHWEWALLDPIEAATPSRLVNVSVRSIAGSGDATSITGFVLSGPKEGSVLIRTLGPALQPLGVTSAAANPALQLFDSAGRLLADNDDWSLQADAAQVGATATRLGAFPLGAGSKDSALLTRLPAGSYSAHAKNPTDALGIVLSEIYDAGTDADAHLANASVRVKIGAGDAVGIVGFVISGTTPRTVLIRAIGPSLTSAGVAGALSDPKIWLYRENTRIMGNDDWGSAATTPLLATTMREIGAFALPDLSKDAALLMQLEPGVHSVHVTGPGAETGIVLVELYLVP